VSTRVKWKQLSAVIS